MRIINGKYNHAKVFTDNIEESCVTQIQSMVDHPAFAHTHIAIMPDTHGGKGSVIGFTMKMNDYVIPNVIGVDIGCGIYSWNLGQVDIDLKALDDFIKENIPSGFHIRKETSNHLQFTYERYGAGIMNSFPLQLAGVCEEVELDREKVLKSIGTLGGGNHFIELGTDQTGDTWLTIHTGSRNFGLRVANYHQKKAKELCDVMMITVPSGMEYLPMSLGGDKYIHDMTLAQEFAHINRMVIAEDILRWLKIAPKRHVFTVHNYINLKDRIIRKGAISAQLGEDVVIPFNMRDGLIIGRGKGNSAWNFSAPHGAGRLLSRTKAKNEVSMEAFTDSMKGIYSTCINKNTLDESPMAYKDKDEIIKNISDSIDIELFVKPIYNFKASEEE